MNEAAHSAEPRPEPEPRIPAQAFGHEVMELLAAAQHRAIRIQDPQVGTEHILHRLLYGDCAAAALTAPGVRAAGRLLGIIAGHDPDDWVGSESGSPEPAQAPSGPAVTVRAALRVTAWDAVRHRRKDLGARPEPTLANRAALAATLDYAAGAGVTHANTLHLMFGLLAEPHNRACESLVEARVDRAELARRLRADPRFHEEGTPHTPLVGTLARLGAFGSPQGLTGRMANRMLSGGDAYNSVMPSVTRSRAATEAVSLGRARVTGAEHVMAILAIDREIGLAGKALKAELAGANRAADVLRGFGVEADAARAALAARADEATAPLGAPVVPELPCGVGAVGLLHRARLESKRQGHPATGTAHILWAALTDPEARDLVADLGADPDAVRNAALNSVRP